MSFITGLCLHHRTYQLLFYMASFIFFPLFQLPEKRYLAFTAGLFYQINSEKSELFLCIAIRMGPSMTWAFEWLVNILEAIPRHLIITQSWWPNSSCVYTFLINNELAQGAQRQTFGIFCSFKCMIEIAWMFVAINKSRNYLYLVSNNTNKPELFIFHVLNSDKCSRPSILKIRGSYQCIMIFSC